MLILEQIPKFAPEKYWAEDGAHPSALGAPLMASYCAHIRIAKKTS